MGESEGERITKRRKEKDLEEIERRESEYGRYWDLGLYGLYMFRGGLIFQMSLMISVLSPLDRYAPSIHVDGVRPQGDNPSGGQSSLTPPVHTYALVPSHVLSVKGPPTTMPKFQSPACSSGAAADGIRKAFSSLMHD